MVNTVVAHMDTCSKTNKVTATLNASGVPVRFSVSLTPWADRPVDVEFPVED